MLGLYVSDHPLMGAEARAAPQDRRHASPSSTERRGRRDRARVGGVVTSLQRKYTKKGDLMAVFVLEDLQSAIEVMVFPKTMPDHGHKLADDAIVMRARAASTTGTTTPKLIVPWTSSCSRASPTAPRRCGSSCPPRRLTEERIGTSSSGCWSSTPASRRCSSTSARARSCACPTTTGSTCSGVRGRAAGRVRHDAVVV